MSGESCHFDRINIVLIGEWRVLIGSIGDFIVFDGFHLTPACLVVDGEFDAPAVLELVEWIIIQGHHAGTNQVLALGNYDPTYEGLFYDAPNNRLLTTLSADFIQPFDGTSLAFTSQGTLSANARGLTVGPGGNIYAADLCGVIWQTLPDLSSEASAAAGMLWSVRDLRKGI